MSLMDVSVRLLSLVVMLLTGCTTFTTNILPAARIVVHVSKRRAQFWEPWEVNKRICPPSLCKFSDPQTGGREEQPQIPRGTAGTPFYQGDIVLKKDDENFIYPESRRRRKRATMRFRNKLWKDAVVPYIMDEGINPASEKVIKRAIQQIELHTCIKFKKKTEKDKDYVRYISEPGCWSNVGKRGGAQLVSIGRGCENVGTAIHETNHALGVWHEQARPDRDEYIKVLKDNISPRFLPDFKKLSKKLATSRGFPYDYSSIMHYNKWAFTRMGEPTLKVIGIGKKLGMTIGQRRALSTIDIAQLRAMYHCNEKEDSAVTFCPKSWFKFKTSCYRLHNRPKHQFSAAYKECQNENAYLVSIESKSEEKFLVKLVSKKFPKVHIWRTGGKAVNGSMVWYKGEKRKPKNMKFTNWGKGMPGTYTSMALVKDKSTKKFLWQGVWTGSVSQLPNHIYAFICEKRAKRKCKQGQYKDGRDYRGKLDHTLDGITCQKWSEQYPHSHKLKPKTSGGREDSDGLGDHNHCRNPSGMRRKKPWCFTTKEKKQWQYCDITICSKKKDKNEVNPPNKSKPTRKPAQRRRPTQRQRSRTNQRRQPGSRRQVPRERTVRKPDLRVQQNAKRKAKDRVKFPNKSKNRKPKGNRNSDRRIQRPGK
ncbi:uncharacterized protein [Haliotis asinina]|uniref:uncharacterized protein n=1 Tax=Haliotis asinina TaxID=109174 RepID=UPI0035318412